MKAVNVPEASKAVDSYAPISAADAVELRRAGVVAVARYPETITGPELSELLAAGLLVWFVVTSPSNGYTPFPALARSKHQAAAGKLLTLGVPTSVSVFCDLEGPGGTFADQLIYADVSCQSLSPFTPGIYVGAGVAATGHELYSIPSAKRYWKSGSKLRDRFGAVQEPDCGYCCIQATKFNVPVGGSAGHFDNDFCLGDYEGRSIIAVGA